MTSSSRSTRVLATAALIAAASPLFAQLGPPATSTNLPPEILSLACAPRATYEEPATPLRITGGQDSFIRRSHAPGDLVTINAGKANGIEVGQEFYVRRLQTNDAATVSRNTPATIRTTGWIKVYAVDDQWSLVTVTHACDTIEIGDYLEPFALPTLPPAPKDRPKAQRNNYAKVVRGDDRRTSFSKGDYLIINRGSDHGIELGSQFVIYRNKNQAENFLFELGEGIAVDVKPELTTVRVTMSLDAIRSGDLVALRREPEEK